MKIISLVHTTFVNDNRVARMASALFELDHDVQILALHKNGLAYHEDFREYSVKRIRPFFHFIPRWNAFIGAIHFFEFILRASWQIRKADVLICNDVEAFLIGLIAKMYNGQLRLIYDCHELESERMGKGKWNKKFVRWLESKYIHRAKMVVTVSPSIQSWYQKSYGLDEVALIRNIPEVVPIKSERVFHDKFNLNASQKVCLYQGALMQGRGLELLMSAFEDFPTNEYVLVIMGGGKLAESIEVRAEFSDKLFFHPMVPGKEIGRYTGSADCGINSVEPLCLSYAYCLPNKFFETVLSEIPILTNDLIDCTNLVSEYKVGAVVSDWTREGIQIAVKEICSRSKSEFSSGFEKFRKENSWSLEKEKWKNYFQNRIHEI
ncbi:MAG: hypothetical protein RL092_945 [Bacteroidota bacterium]|jgi:hypothetical protein